jgi:hypothetical protein
VARSSGFYNFPGIAKLKKLFVLTLLPLCSLVHSETTDTSNGFGSYRKLFSANSLWNSRPVNPVLGTFQIPITRDAYSGSIIYPSISTGKYSAGIFKAQASDSSMVIYPRGSNAGVWDPDGGTWLPTVTIPHWPADTLGAEGSDGHADIVDGTTGIVYSLYQLAKDDSGHWTASQIAWSPISGTGWGDPAHYYQGARATGVPTSAGMIRTSEVDDGKDLFEHALAMSLDNSALSPSPTFIAPATSADYDASWTNTGKIPEGARMMLPASFDLDQITDANLRKVAKTLKTYGAYVVDRNTNTSFGIYAENGSGWSLMPTGWSNSVASQLELIRQALRQVVSQDGFINGNSEDRPEDSRINMLSLRGPWLRIKGTDDKGVFNTFTQALEFGTTEAEVRQIQTGVGMGKLAKYKPVAPKRYKLWVHSTGGATLQFKIWVGGSGYLTTEKLGDGDSQTFVWPTAGWSTVTAFKPAGGPASIQVRFIEVPEGE